MIKWRRLRWAEYVACVEEKRKAYRILVTRYKRKRRLRRQRGVGKRIVFVNVSAKESKRWLIRMIY